MDARTVDEVARQLRSKRLRVRDTLVLGLLGTVLAPPAWLYEPALGIAVAAGVGVQLLLAIGALVSRRTQLEDLAVDPAAYAIPDVQAFGRRLAGPRERELLARGILSLLRDVFRPGNLYLADRVVEHARDLEAIARDLRSPAVRVQPAAVALCRRMLTRAAESPLYNPRLPAEDLRAWLWRIRSGIERPGLPHG